MPVLGQMGLFQTKLLPCFDSLLEFSYSEADVNIEFVSNIIKKTVKNVGSFNVYRITFTATFTHYLKE